MTQLLKAKVDRQLSGATGEAVVIYELMWREWLPANVNFFVRNARNVDVIATKGKRTVNLTVKTSGKNGGGNFQLGGTSADDVFNRHEGVKAEFVVFVVIDKAESKKYRCFIVPVEEAELRVKEAHRIWLSFPRRDGEKRKDGIRGINFYSRDTETNKASDFANKWKKYENAWGQLEQTKRNSWPSSKRS